MKLIMFDIFKLISFKLTLKAIDFLIEISLKRPKITATYIKEIVMYVLVMFAHEMDTQTRNASIINSMSHTVTLFAKQGAILILLN